MKKISALLAWIMLTGTCSFALTQNVSLDKIRSIADQKARNLWGDVQGSQPLAYYSSNDEVIGYRFTYAFSQPFPGRQSLLQQCDGYRLAGDSKLQWGIDRFGTLFISARTDMAVIQDYSKALSPEYAVGGMMEEKAREILGGSVTLKKAYYINFQNQWFCYTDGIADVYIKPFPKLVSATEAEFHQKVDALPFFCAREDFSAEWDRYLSGNTDAPGVQVWIPNHDGNCRFYDWSYGCSPTAAAMLLSYWDYLSLSSASNYAKLVDYYFQRWDGIQGEIDYQVPNTNKELAIAMNTDTVVDGGTDRDNIVPGYASVCNTTNGYNFACTDHGESTVATCWAWVVNDIDAGRPIHISIPGHSECCVAYQVSDYTIGVHNTWYEGVQWISRSQMERTYSIVPGGATGYGIELTSPKGDTIYNHNGSGQTWYAGDVYEITWDYDYSSGSYVRLYYSVTGGLSWTTITSNTENDGVYDWVIPAGINSTTCRIRVYFYTSGGVFSGADASLGNLKILSGGSIAELTSDAAVYTNTDPDYYQFNQAYATWCAVGVRAYTSGENWSMQMFGDLTFTPPAIATSTYTYPVDFVVMDRNHAPAQDRGIKVYRVSGSSGCYTEFEGSYETLSVGDNNSISWPATDVVEMWDVHLLPGYYKISLNVVAGTTDLGMALYGSSGAAYYAGRQSYMGFSDNSGAAVAESFWVTITSEDDYGLCVWANDASVANFNIKIEKSGQWIGSTSNNWHTASNWAAEYIPTSATDVEITTGYTYFPIISAAMAYCNNITVGSGAILRVFTQDLTVSGNMTIQGQLEITNSAGDIDVAGSVYWDAGSTANFSAAGRMYVDGNWEFRNGANAQLANGYVYFTGSGSSFIRSYETNCAFKNLLNSKSGGFVSFSDLSTDTLKINGYLYVYTDQQQYCPSSYPVVLAGQLYNYGHINCAAGTFIFNGSSHSVDLNTGDYFNNVIISSSGNTSMADSLRIHGSLTIESGALVTNNYPIQIRGNWTNLVGTAGFSEGTGMVNFEGSAMADILTDETFYDLNIYSGYAGFDAVEFNDSITVTHDLKINTGTLEMNAGSRLNVGNTLTITSGAGLNANDNDVVIYIYEDWYDYNVTPSTTVGFDAGSYSIVHFRNLPSNLQAVREPCPFNDVIIEGSGSYVRPSITAMTCANMTIKSGTFRLAGYKTTITENLVIGTGTLREDVATDTLVVGGDITWQAGSNDLVSAGVITIGDDWTFDNGTNAVLGTGNTVIFNTTTSSFIYCKDPEAAFGNVVLDKTSPGYTYIHASSPDTMQVAGIMTLHPGNLFNIQSRNLVVDSTLDIQSTAEMSLFSPGYVLNNNETFVLNGKLNVTTGTVLVHGEFDMGTAGEIDLSGGSFTSDATGTGWHYVRGILNISSGAFELTHGSLLFSSTASTVITGGEIHVGTAFSATTAGTFLPTGGSVVCNYPGSGNAYIYFNTGNNFWDLVINGQMYMQNDIRINNDLAINSGYLSSGSSDIYIEGDWSNSVGPGGFLEGSNCVFFSGADSADILTNETFFDVVINKTYADFDALELMSNLSMTVTHDLFIQNGVLEMNNPAILDIGHDLWLYDGAGLNANDGSGMNIFIAGNWNDANTNHSIYNGFDPYYSVVTFDGTTDQYLTTNCSSEEFYDIRIDKSAGLFRPNDALAAQRDIYLVNGGWEDNVAGLTHSLVRDFNVSSTGVLYNATPLNTITFTGSQHSVLTYANTAGYFHNIVVNKTAGYSVTQVGNTSCQFTGNLTVQSGTYDQNGYSMFVSGNTSINNGGVLNVPAGSVLKHSDGKSIEVLNGGLLNIVGSSAYPVTLQANVTTARYAINVNSGGTIAAQYCTFKHTGPNGVYIAPGAIVGDVANAFRACTFQDGAAGGTLLAINNSQVLTIRNAVFPPNTWAGNSNVAKTLNTGHVYFVDYSGGFSGEGYDADGWNLIDWVPALTATATATPPSICAGSSSQLNINLSGGLAPHTYQWSPTTGLSNPALPYPVATPASTTTYYVTVTDNLGTTATSNVTVTVNPVLPVSVTITASANPSPPGNFVTFNAFPVNGGSLPSYQWKVNGVNVGTGLTNYSYVPNYNDQVKCVLTSNYVCPSGNPATSNTIVMIVVPVTTTVTGTIPSGLNLCFDASNTVTVAGGGTTFTVQSGGSATMIAGFKISYLYGTTVQPGGYMHGYITTTNAYCGSLTKSMVAAAGMNVESGEVPVRPEELKADSYFTLYPNPAEGRVTLFHRSGIVPGPVQVDFFDMRGTCVRTTGFTGEQSHLIGLGDLPPGLYFVKVASQGRVESFKLVVVR